MRGATAVLPLPTLDELFQSTRPMRGATDKDGDIIASAGISIHAPHAGRDLSGSEIDVGADISIHAPHAGRDDAAGLGTVQEDDISIHAPHAGRDLIRRGSGVVKDISIHAPHAGRDARRAAAGLAGAYFNPRAPCGARPRRVSSVSSDWIFQSTRPMRGATAKVNKLLCTFLQKRHGFQIFLRKTLPFKAFCRLQIGKNFSICGANRCGNFCELLLRTIRSSVLPEGRSACSQNAQFYSHTFSRDNRNADCLFPDP